MSRRAQRLPWSMSFLKALDFFRFSDTSSDTTRKNIEIIFLGFKTIFPLRIPPKYLLSFIIYRLSFIPSISVLLINIKISTVRILRTIFILNLPQIIKRLRDIVNEWKTKLNSFFHRKHSCKNKNIHSFKVHISVVILQIIHYFENFFTKIKIF